MCIQINSYPSKFTLHIEAEFSGLLASQGSSLLYWPKDLQ